MRPRCRAVEDVTDLTKTAEEIVRDWVKAGYDAALSVKHRESYPFHWVVAVSLADITLKHFVGDAQVQLARVDVLELTAKQCIRGLLLNCRPEP